MPSAKKLNGYPLQDGQLSDQSNLSGQGTQPPTSLGFANSRHPVNLKKDHHLGRHERWDKGRQHQREILWQYLAERDRHSTSIRFKDVLALFFIAAIAMTVATLFIVGEDAILRSEPTKEVVR
jgi:hypothetical protein